MLKTVLERLLPFLSIATIGMIVLALIRKDKYKISSGQAIIAMLFSSLSGVLGTLILFYIENGFWGGQSFFGAVLFAPVFLYPVSIVIKMKYSELMSLCAPIEAFVLAFMKIRCFVDGCCGANSWFELNSPIPIQLLETILGFVVMFILLRLEKDENNKKCLYAWYLVIYGSVRFVINTFRADLAAFIILPAGHFWALISIMIGTAILYKTNRMNKIN